MSNNAVCHKRTTYSEYDVETIMYCVKDAGHEGDCQYETEQQGEAEQPGIWQRIWRFIDR